MDNSGKASEEIDHHCTPEDFLHWIDALMVSTKGEQYFDAGVYSQWDKKGIQS